MKRCHKQRTSQHLYTRHLREFTFSFPPDCCECSSDQRAWKHFATFKTLLMAFLSSWWYWVPTCTIIIIIAIILLADKHTWWKFPAMTLCVALSLQRGVGVDRFYFSAAIFGMGLQLDCTFVLHATLIALPKRNMSANCVLIADISQWSNLSS